MKVALLDSGIGGWSFLTKIEERFPQHTYLYFADQFNCPYGNKSFEELEEIASKWIKVFKDIGVEVLMIACNTLTALFKHKFEEELNIPVFGTTDGLEKQKFTDKNMVLLATVRTANSQWYQKLFPDIDLCQIGNVWLARTIEKNFSLSMEELSKLKEEVEDSVDVEWEKLILGCTHYPLIQDQLKSIWPDKKFIDPADTIIEELKELLNSNESVDGNIIMYTSGDLDLLKGQVSSFFDEKKRKKIFSGSIFKIKERF